MISSLALALAVSLPQAPQDFPTPRVIAEATDGEFRAHGDFDHDGDVDLLHFRGSVLDWTGVRVFENVGDGDFVPGPETLFHFPASYTSGRLQPFVGDFDGDSNLDFVIARDGAGAALGEGLEFFFGDGSLGWSSRALLPMATPRWIAIGDIDGDAALEVAVSHIDASYQNMLSWVDVQGGVPIALPPYVLTAGVAPTVIVFDVVDVDGDGLDDIAATATAGSVVDRVQFFPTVAVLPTGD